MTTHTTQAHRPSSKGEINLIILQVNMNEIKNKFEELKYITSPPCAPIRCTRQGVDLSHSLDTT